MWAFNFAGEIVAAILSLYAKNYSDALTVFRSFRSLQGYLFDGRRLVVFSFIHRVIYRFMRKWYMLVTLQVYFCSVLNEDWKRLLDVVKVMMTIRRRSEKAIGWRANLMDRLVDAPLGVTLNDSLVNAEVAFRWALSLCGFAFHSQRISLHTVFAASLANALIVCMMTSREQQV